MRTKTRKVYWDFEKRLGEISSTENAQWIKELNRIAWNGTPAKFDIRSWSPNHKSMTRGITISDTEMELLCSGYSEWKARGNDLTQVCKSPKFIVDSGRIEVAVYEQIACLSDRGGWTRELTVTAWNGSEPRFDIREWSPAHDKMTRGIALKEAEADTVCRLYLEYKEKGGAA